MNASSSRRAPITRLLVDDAGGEVIEYAVILGLVSVAAIAMIGSFGVKVLARWSSINSSM